MGVKTSSSEIYTVSQLETELNQFYKYCKDNNLTDEEISNICRPLMQSDFKSKYFKTFIIFLIVLLTLYFMSYFETVQWHYSAIGRLFLIELLPVWNWKEMKNEKCLIKTMKSDTNTNADIMQDCTYCEYIHNIDVVDAKESEFIHQKYIKLNKPAILENGIEYWTNTVDFQGILDAMFDDETLANSHPCKFKSNTYSGTGNLYQSLKNLDDYSSYFVHFQNCDFNAVKAFRKYFKRPKFLATEIYPIQYSWLLISQNYNVNKFKPIVLTDQITVVGQFLGRNDIILHPHECGEDCEVLKIDLRAGEVLIFGGVWNMEYRPFGEGQNMAVILETH